jgi:uncharacterized membrane protein YcaP (DUF421 family)
MEWLITIFGTGKDLTVVQMSCRAIAVFLLALVLLRITGQRTFGHKTAFDQVVMIMLGAILSRGVTGSSPFFPVISASVVIVVLHRVLGWISMYNKTLGMLVKGEEIILYKNGRYHQKSMQKCMVTEKDMLESVRIETNADDLANVDIVTMERCGSISIVTKEKK